MIGLIGIDVDGTLLDSEGRIPDDNRDAIHDAVARGIHVALVTGRSFPFARPIADALPLSLSLIVSSGAVERTMDGATLARRLLDRDVARGLLAAHARPSRRGRARLRSRRRPAGDVRDDGLGASGAEGLLGQEQVADCPVRPARGCARGGSDPGDVQRRRGWHACTGRRVAAGGGRVRGIAHAEYVHRDFSLIDVTAPTATKGRALAWRAEQLGLTRDEVMAIGDNLNDVEMLEYRGDAGHHGQRRGRLEGSGLDVTGHQNEAGLAQAIRRFAL